MSEIIRLSKLVNEILNEVGDLKGIKPEKWHRISDKYIFNVDDNKVLVNFQSWSHNQVIDIIVPSVDDGIFQDTINKKRALLVNSYNLGYSVNGRADQSKITDLKTLYRILSTVVAIVKDFIETDKPFILTIFSASKFGGISNDKQKDLIYAEISKQHLPSNYYLRDIHIKKMMDDNDTLIENFKGLILFKRK